MGVWVDSEVAGCDFPDNVYTAKKVTHIAPKK